ncbi:MAG TPA: response regulator, partial [Polyangiaceae bacterium]|nr:response regulator [Polyangiaceae bacterium]
PSGPYVVVAVSDTGVGMAAATQAHLFEPFFTTKDVGKGTGLGLATVYGIVRKCGGHIHVSSSPNQGSTFRLYFPYMEHTAQGTSRSLVVSKARSSMFAVSDGVRGATILLVEDEPSVRKVTQRILQAEGFRVYVAESGEEALSLIGRIAEPIDLLITDLAMAEMGGCALSEQLRQQRPTLRTLFISGYSRDQAIAPGTTDSHSTFLAKPFTRDVLIKKIATLLRGGESEVDRPIRMGESS